MNTITPIMEPEDIERELLRRIEAQAAMIKAALAYIQAGRPEIATLVLNGGLAENTQND